MDRNEVLKHLFPDEADSLEHEVELEESHEQFIEPEYNGELRYMNKSPMELKRLAETVTDPEELKAIKFALGCQRAKFDAEVGTEPFRGENLDAREIKKLSELIDPANRDPNPFPVPQKLGQPSIENNSTEEADSLFDLDLLKDFPPEE